ncbi:hypothetical protein [Microbacterium enclense]|uniref:Uncharacterized protein n=1 Tax=Microbacterium enclense TaxID=993073 RepID=A0A1G6NRR0_9MICO|nr:hypothetical protein [Microbacterium enclense]KSU52874.1 hypothetical protein AS029_12760 [Microbacterium enclense]SDC70593.1 hypothetical protein SAMN05216418_2831 [Microbacterium enclense]
MSKRDTRPIEVGDRFETRDARDGGKVVEVVEVKRNALGAIRYLIRTEVHPRNPSAVGRAVRVQESTLRGAYKRVSR